MIPWEAFWQYVGVGGTLLASCIGAPIPEEIPIATAGILVGRVWNEPNGVYWWIMLPVCIVCVVVCDCMLYLIGRRWGTRIMQWHWVQKRVLSPDRRAKIEKNFNDYGIGILLIARLLPGIRAPIFITAGMMKLPFRKFVLADGLYAIPGVNLLFWLAFVFADSFMDLLKRLDTYRELCLVAVIAYVAGFVTSMIINKPATEGNPDELPVVGKTVAIIHSHLVGEHKHDEHAQPHPEVNPGDQPATDKSGASS